MKIAGCYLEFITAGRYGCFSFIRTHQLISYVSNLNIKRFARADVMNCVFRDLLALAIQIARGPGLFGKSITVGRCYTRNLNGPFMKYHSSDNDRSMRPADTKRRLVVVVRGIKTQTILSVRPRPQQTNEKGLYIYVCVFDLIKTKSFPQCRTAFSARRPTNTRSAVRGAKSLMITYLRTRERLYA